MTAVERLRRPTTLYPRAGFRRLAGTLSTALAGALVLGVTTLPSSAGASSIAAERAEARHLYAEIQRADADVARLGQRYDAAELKVASEQNLITHTRQIVAQSSLQVSADEAALRKVAVAYYVNSGAAAGSSALFTGNDQSLGAASVYTQIAQGNLAQSEANLTNNSLELTHERRILEDQYHQAAAASRAAAQSLQRAQDIQTSLSHQLSSVNTTIANDVAAAERAAAAAAARKWRHDHPTSHRPSHHRRYADGYPIPPVPHQNPRVDIAIRAAESYLGVPYVWGGASRSGVDCSGLIMLAWEAAGVDLPHYSGSQWDDTIHIPRRDIRPGDLIFYGYDGDTHVTMYLGHGLMIEAPETGQVVHITPVRYYGGYFGIGRVR